MKNKGKVSHAKEIARGDLEHVDTVAILTHPSRFLQSALKKLAFLALACASIAIAPQGAQAAMVTVVHGINGSDLGLPSNLPVDIAVNGNCAIKAVSFRQLARVELEAGTYSITVHPSNNNCSLAPAISQSVTVPASARSIGLVANLSNSGKPQLTAFVNDSNSTRSITVNNAAANTSVFAGAGPGRLIFFYGNALPSGTGVFVLGDPNTSNITVEIYREDAKRRLFREKFRFNKSRVYYVVGSKKSGLRVVVDKS